MNYVEAALRAVVVDLDRHGAAWVLVGGFAVSARAEPRFTRDIDIAVAVSDDDMAETLVRELVVDGYRVLASIEQDATARLATVRLARGREGVVIDLLFASSGIEPEMVAAAETIEIVPGLAVPVATVGHLIAVKLLSRDDDVRPQDRGDLLALRAVAGPADLGQARAAVDLITTRGFQRGRDLAAALAELLTGRS